MGTLQKVGARVAVSCLAFVTAAACGEDPASSADRVVVSDSAGVEIVRIPASQYRAATGDAIRAASTATVGSISGPEGQRFFRIGTVRWLDTTRLAVANASTQVRIYTSSGALETSFGREGEGPQEFRRIQGVLPTGSGTLLVLDGGLARISTFDTDGSLLSTTRRQDSWGVSPDLVTDSVIVGLWRDPTPVNGPKIERRTDSVVVLSAKSGTRTASVSLPSSLVWWVRIDDLSMDVPVGRTLSPNAYASAGAGIIVSGTSDRYALNIFDDALRLQRIVRVDVPAQPVTASVRAFHEDRWDAEDHDEDLRPPFADSIPHFRNLEVDRDGRIWVRLEQGRGEPDVKWDVFSPDGRDVRRVHLPPGVSFRDATGAVWAGVRTDELDVEYLELGHLSGSPWNAP